MGSASHALYFLLISFSTFLFFHTHLMGAAWDLMNKPKEGSSTGVSSTGDLGLLDNRKEREIEKVSGEDNVGKEMGMLILEKFRVLLGLQSSYMERTRSGIANLKHGLSPAPAPVEEALTPSPVPPLHTHIYSRRPLHRQGHNPSVRHLEDRRRKESKARHRRIVIAVVVSVAATLVIFGVAVVLVFYRRLQRNWKKRSERTMALSRRRSKIPIPSSVTNKVSFDPGPDMFYLNSLAPFVESECRFKQTCETKNVLANENMSSSPSQHGEQMKCESDTVSNSAEDEHGEQMKCESDNVSCSAEEVFRIETLSSDDESFHSVCNSHCSIDRASSDMSDTNSSHPSENCLTFNISNASLSPISRLPESSPMKSPILPAPSDSTHSISFNLQRPPCPFSEILKRKKSQALCSSTSSKICQSDPQNTTCSSNLHVTPFGPCSSSTDSKNSHVKAETPSVPLKLDPFPLRKKTPQASMPSPNPNELPPTNVVKPPHPPPSIPLVRNGNIPKPPPPPSTPPPLPPPFQKGCNSTLPPPPPPWQLEQYTPVGKDGAPLPKLKPLHWDKVRAAPDRSMVWDKIRSSSFELDEKMIESLFGYNLQNSAKNEEAKIKSSSPSKHVLEPKRLQNITILSKALNATTEQICDALKQGGGLNVQQLEALVKMVLTKEEEEKLSNYEGDVDELGSAEKFIKTILNIPFAFWRIEVMLYKETFEDEVVHLKKSFAMLEEACKELRSSRLFLRLLEAVLKTGNRMNVGTIRGGARAFKLDALLKLADVKGTDGKTTLLHFVVQEMIRSEGVSPLEMEIQKTNKKNKPNTVEEREEDYRKMGLDHVSGLSTELCNVKKTASVDLDVLASSVSNLSIGMDKLKHLVEEDLSQDLQNRSFVQSMKSFLSHAEITIKELKDDEDQVLLHVKEITEYYHGDVSKDEANPLRIFVIVRDFLGMLDRVCKEVRSLKTHQSPNLVLPFR